MKIIIYSIILGLAGFDPLGAVIVMAALSRGISKAKILQFTVIALVSTVAFGVLFSSGIGAGGHLASNIPDQIPDIFYVIMDFAIAIVAGVWFVRRVFFKKQPSGGEPAGGEDKKESKFMAFARKSMPLAGFLFAFWAMTDPTFWAVVALTVQNGGLLMQILCCTIWMILGQLPLFVLTIAVMFGAHEKLIERFNRFLDKNNRREKLHRIVQWLITLLALVITVYFVVEPIIYLVTGNWIA